MAENMVAKLNFYFPNDINDNQIPPSPPLNIGFT